VRVATSLAFFFDRLTSIRILARTGINTCTICERVVFVIVDPFKKILMALKYHHLSQVYHFASGRARIGLWERRLGLYAFHSVEYSEHGTFVIPVLLENPFSKLSYFKYIFVNMFTGEPQIVMPPGRETYATQVLSLRTSLTYIKLRAAQSRSRERRCGLSRRSGQNLQTQRPNSWNARSWSPFSG
jgi:hypothetical protein